MASRSCYSALFRHSRKINREPHQRLDGGQDAPAGNGHFDPMFDDNQMRTHPIRWLANRCSLAGTPVSTGLAGAGMVYSLPSHAFRATQARCSLERLFPCRAAIRRNLTKDEICALSHWKSIMPLKL
jgi:hypothetical protein